MGGLRSVARIGECRCPGKMSVHGRTDIEYQGTDQVTGVKRSVGGALFSMEAARVLG